MTTFDTFETPFGPFSVALSGDGGLVASAFGDRAALTLRLRQPLGPRDPVRAAAARAQLSAYFAGERTTFTLPCAAVGSAFQQRVWQALTEIPYGETRSYGALAAQLGSSPRAVGRANATNPRCVIVPCHRVIGSDGTLTGFAFGEATKRALLELERAHQPGGRPATGSLVPARGQLLAAL